MPLTDPKVKNAKSLEKEYKLTDGFGMHLLVHPNTGAYLTVSTRNREYSLLVSTLLFHFPRQESAGMKRVN